MTRLPEYLIALVIATVPFYAFLTVWAASFVGHYTLARLWPEYMLAPLALWAIIVLIRDRKVRKSVLTTRLSWLVIAYLLLNVLLGVVALWHGTVNLKAFLYGLLLDTRPLIWFGVVWVSAAAGKLPWLRKNWQRVVLIPLAAIVAFAIVQFLVLPSNFLAHFGYKAGVTIAPIQTINQDTTTIRAQSLLRGPNPLGAYLVAGLGIALFAGLRFWRKALIIASTGAALLVTFSRSAWLGLLGVVAAAIALLWRRRYLKLTIILTAVVLAIGMAGLYALRNNGGLQNAVLHVNEHHSTASVTSNTGHLSGASGAVHDMLQQPFGKGPGTAGPASIYDRVSPARDSESYYLNIGQEIGWLGLGVFIWVVLELARTLRRGRSCLSRGLFASFVGLAIVNIFSYAWTDPSLTYVWWGLAGLAVGGIAKPSSAPKKYNRTLAYVRARYDRLRPSKQGGVQFMYYNLGGIVFFVSGYALFALLYGWLHWYWLLAKGLADIIGWTFNYLIQHYLAFGESARLHGHKKVLKKYVPFSVLNIGIDYATVGGLRLLGMTPFVGIWIASLFFSGWKWLWYKHWIFKKPVV